MKCFLLHSGELAVRRLAHLLDIESGRFLPKETSWDTVIRWGALAPEPAQVNVLNRQLPVLRAANPKAVGELLRLNGISHSEITTDSEDEPGLERSANIIYSYQVPVFHLEALAVFEQKKGFSGSPAFLPGRKPDWTEVPVNGTTRVRRIVKQAVRAVYAVGLDYGLVHLAVTAEAKSLITRVDPLPELGQHLMELFADAINRFSREADLDNNKADTLVLGADPEFLLRNSKGKVVSASKYMNREGTAGCDAVVLKDSRSCLTLAEVRPAPSSNPKTLVKHIRLALLQANRQISNPDLAWLSGGMPVRGLPLGGHVHFSGIRLTPRLLRALDNYLALPLLLLEGENSRKRRPKYGWLGEFRRKEHGGFEYRALSSWLSTPRLAEAVLCLARIVGLHHNELNQEPLQLTDTCRRFYLENSAGLLTVVLKLWNELESMPAYDEYRSELDWLKAAVSEGSPVMESPDFRSAWKIPVGESSPVLARSIPIVRTMI